MITDRDILERILANQQAIMKIIAEKTPDPFLQGIIKSNAEMLKIIWGE